MKSRPQPVRMGRNSLATLTSLRAPRLASVVTVAPQPEAQFNRPQGLYIDIYDNLYIADSKNNVIREVPAVTVTTPVPMTAGNIYTVAGKQSAGAGYSGNTASRRTHSLTIRS